MIVRVRYAPSPTGNQHIGSVRTALFNYLYARSRGGKFILRLEDTDRSRCDEKYVTNLYETFDWLGFRWDEGPDVSGPSAPYIQSERLELYRKYADELIKKDLAYYCFCTSDRLERIRKEREAAHSSESGYDRLCRDIPAEEAERRAAGGEPHTIRLKIPLGSLRKLPPDSGQKLPQDSAEPVPSTVFYDHILGNIEWKNQDLNPDPVLLKSDGYPTYHLAVVVDDHLMGVTHILRAQEWLPSTPLHVIMYNGLGWEKPEFCHLPMVMGLDGKKLSKRHGASSIDEFRSQGYLPEALINYVAMVGCSYEEGKDIYTLEELASHFSIEKLNKAPAIFDYKKLEWYNGQYIRMKTDEELARLAGPLAIDAGLFDTSDLIGTKIEPDDEQWTVFVKAMPLIKERINFLKEVPVKINYLFHEVRFPEPQEFFPKKTDLAGTISLLKKGRELISAISPAKDDAEAETLTKAFAEKEELKLGDLMMPVRVAITGERISPPLFGSIRLLGTQKALDRIDKALEWLNK